MLIAGLHVPYNFITNLEKSISSDPALSEHFQKITNAIENGDWFQSRVRTEGDETPTWILSVPDLESRIEQWRVNQSMSHGFKDECHLTFSSEE